MAAGMSPVGPRLTHRAKSNCTPSALQAQPMLTLSCLHFRMRLGVATVERRQLHRDRYSFEFSQSGGSARRPHEFIERHETIVQVYRAKRCQHPRYGHAHVRSCSILHIE